MSKQPKTALFLDDRTPELKCTRFDDSFFLFFRFYFHFLRLTMHTHTKLYPSRVKRTIKKWAKTNRNLKQKYVFS